MHCASPHYNPTFLLQCAAAVTIPSLCCPPAPGKLYLGGRGGGQQEAGSPSDRSLTLEALLI